jgi:hypothetical protein
MEWTERAACMGKGEVHSGLGWEILRGENFEETYSWVKDNIKTNLQEIGWIDLARYMEEGRAVVNTVMIIRIQ